MLLLSSVPSVGMLVGSRRLVLTQCRRAGSRREGSQEAAAGHKAELLSSPARQLPSAAHSVCSHLFSTTDTKSQSGHMQYKTSVHNKEYLVQNILPAVSTLPSPNGATTGPKAAWQAELAGLTRQERRGRQVDRGQASASRLSSSPPPAGLAAHSTPLGAVKQAVKPVTAQFRPLVANCWLSSWLRGKSHRMSNLRSNSTCHLLCFIFFLGGGYVPSRIQTGLTESQSSQKTHNQPKPILTRLNQLNQTEPLSQTKLNQIKNDKNKKYNCLKVLCNSCTDP